MEHPPPNNTRLGFIVTIAGLLLLPVFTALLFVTVGWAAKAWWWMWAAIQG